MSTPQERYLAAAHAMQTGVAMEMEHGSKDTTPKHLRTGVNSAMVEHSALAGLLISKGVITGEEYAEALAAGMERETKAYEDRLSEHIGTKITLA